MPRDSFEWQLEQLSSINFLALTFCSNSSGGSKEKADEDSRKKKV